MDQLTTTIERIWFRQIVCGCKRIEYREIKPYWTDRLMKVKTPFRLVLRNGMRAPVPVVTVIIGKVAPRPGTRTKRKEYELHIRRVVKVEHWDRRKAEPK